MQSRDFCFWLQGLLEMSQGLYEEHGFSAEQVKMLKRHLSLVFVHEIDPAMGDQTYQDKLNDIHGKDPNKVPVPVIIPQFSIPPKPWAPPHNFDEHPGYPGNPDTSKMRC